jgi:hypothetical protein
MVVTSLVKDMVYRVSLVIMDSLGTSQVMVIKVMGSLVKDLVLVEARKDYKLRYWWNNDDDVKSTSDGGWRWRH